VCPSAGSTDISFPIFIIPSFGNKCTVKFGVVYLDFFNGEFKNENEQKADKGGNYHFPPSQCVLIPSKQNECSD